MPKKRKKSFLIPLNNIFNFFTIKMLYFLTISEFSKIAARNADDMRVLPQYMQRTNECVVFCFRGYDAAVCRGNPQRDGNRGKRCVTRLCRGEPQRLQGTYIDFLT
jgi:hypothetical protein